MIHAMGLYFHENHFQCIKCERELADLSFHSSKGMPFCDRCHAEENASKCYTCSQPIMSSALMALGKNYHPSCFVCKSCKKEFGNDSFFPIGNEPFCEACHSDTLAPCKGCGKAVSGVVISAVGGSWHEDCFVCGTCKNPFPNQEFFELDDVPYCKQHFHEKRGTICNGCMGPIEGQYINALDAKWHVEHFTCALCMAALANTRFRERNASAYCQPCYVKMFG
ncbi:uncharacterized protein MONBRDRAFT_19246 [Monosiga brevicollis MX1]|uniref:LIM zinc-binding domain-containing protein n=1 Tax=Monosiga brevicollis TaxID=81824 RepID=A9UQ92_MONBE|nr:uncharacterized protein MONBRDRAFT_19246 [Monosiga brevicollis MX1]EDQ93007.1 predicted protein [Monosiga brevicollis MX1]|eukprot:XP_001742769.1 hypothetical protein [Monosiga brevicollis MX1]